jgi:hypothetical protein
MLSNLRSTAMILLLAAVCLVAGFFAGRASTAPEQPAPEALAAAELKRRAEATNAIYSTYPNVQDAMRRWAAKLKVPVERAMEGYSIEMMHFHDRDCIQFNLEVGAVGGEPIYCYRLHTSEPSGVPRLTTELVYEHSDVE